MSFYLFKIPVYKKMEDAMNKHKDADVLVNFASLRSAYESTMETLNYPQVRLKLIAFSPFCVKNNITFFFFFANTDSHNCNYSRRNSRELYKKAYS